jgi:hypothetical protein
LKTRASLTFTLLLSPKGTTCSRSRNVSGFSFYYILEVLQFVEIAKGSIQLSNEKYYRHQVCMFLTLSDKGQAKINCIIMPSYSDIQDGKKIFRLNALPYSIEWSSKCKESGA